LIIFVRLREQLKARLENSRLPSCRMNNNLLEVSLDHGATVKDLLVLLKLPESLVGLIIVNGRQEPAGRVLSHGDQVELFSPMVGG
jgi:sulfur carrier protein ThiS